MTAFHPKIPQQQVLPPALKKQATATFHRREKRNLAKDHVSWDEDSHLRGDARPWPAPGRRRVRPRAEDPAKVRPGP